MTLNRRPWRAALAVAAIGLTAGLSRAAAAEQPIHRQLTLAISPDGSRIVTVEGDAPPSGGAPTVRDLVIRTTDGAGVTHVPLPCGRVAECWPASPVWTPDGRRIVFTLRTPGSHARSIWTVGADGSSPEKLIDFNGTITALRYGPGARLSMLATEGALKEVGATEAGAPILGDLGGPPAEQRIATFEGGSLKWASPPDLYVYDYDVAPDGSFVGTAAPGDGDNNWWVAKLFAFSGGEARVIHTPPDARHQIANPRLSPDGRTLAFISGLMSDFGSTGGDIFLLPMGGGGATNVTSGLRASATSIGWGCDGKLLARLLNGGQTQIADVAAGRPPQVLWSGQESLSGERAGMAIGCPSAMTATVHETFDHAPEVEFGPIGAWRDITHDNAALTAEVEVRSLSWTSDGARVQGWLLLPRVRPAGRIPMITEIHGGPAAAFTPGFVGGGETKALLDRGYALFRPNPRGSFGQGEAFTQGNVRDFGHGDLRDIMAGVDAAERAAAIDDTRLGITGGSYGGYMTMWAVTQTDRFKAAVAGAGISDWLSYYGENGIDQWMIPYFGASAYKDPQVYARSAPITYITRVHTPVFEFVGANDVECPPAQTQEFWHALRDLGVPTSMAIYPGEGHGLRDPAHQADAVRRALEWFDRYLKPGPHD